jgi:hypothetical protein
MTDFFNKYFEEHIDYPSDIIHNPLPINEMWNYVSSDILNAFINYVKPIKWYALDRYTNLDWEIDSLDETALGRYTKREAIKSFIDGELKFSHTNLKMFDDDCIILAEYDFKYNDWEYEDDEYKELSNMNHFIFFWFDCDTSDCSIGKFRTTDSKEDVIKSLETMLNEDSKGHTIEKQYDNGLSSYTEIPVNLLSGWISF